MFEIGNVYFMAEILSAELIFLYSVPKRKKFPLLYLCSVCLCLGISYLFPMPSAIKYNTFYQLFRFLALFGVTVAAMGLCFRVPISALFSFCVAGYAVQHAAYHITSIAAYAGFLRNFESGILSMRILREIIVFPIVYLVMFFTFGLFAARNESYKKVDMRFNALSFAIVFICIGLSRFARYFNDFNSVSVSIYAVTCCILALVIQFILYKMMELRLENATIRLLWREEQKQYEERKKNIELLNLKYHDLKHRLSEFDGKLTNEEIKSIKDVLRGYAVKMKTGNDALDVLLTENSMRCKEENIELTYVGNGADLSFMNVMDVYSLFGNAVSNAIEAVRKLSDPEKKIIDISIESKGDFVTVHVSNYFTGEVVFEDGLPRTDKTEEEGYHGFGIKSMKLIAEKYGGSMQITAEGEIFNLGIYLLNR